jgi:hypothetical protein
VFVGNSSVLVPALLLKYSTITSVPPDEKEVKKQYTESELNAKLDELTQDLKKYGVEGWLMGVNSADQKLVVHVPKISDEARQALQAKYGDLLEITVDNDFWLRYSKPNR